MGPETVCGYAVFERAGERVRASLGAEGGAISALCRKRQEIEPAQSVGLTNYPVVLLDEIVGFCTDVPSGPR